MGTSVAYGADNVMSALMRPPTGTSGAAGFAVLGDQAHSGGRLGDLLAIVVQGDAGRSVQGWGPQQGEGRAFASRISPEARSAAASGDST